MSKTIDKILDILDQPMQRSTEPAYPTERTDEGCWRCGVRLPEPTTVENDLGACERCVADLRNEVPARSERPVESNDLTGQRWGESSPYQWARRRIVAGWRPAQVVVDELTIAWSHIWCPLCGATGGVPAAHATEPVPCDLCGAPTTPPQPELRGIEGWLAPGLWDECAVPDTNDRRVQVIHHSRGGRRVI